MANAYFTLLLISLCVLCFNVHATPTPRILGGKEVAAGKHPSTVSVRIDHVPTCGGNIIGERFVITAAHCVSELIAFDANRVTVRVGSINFYAGGKIFEVANIRRNPESGNFLNDLAILELTLPLTWSDSVKSIALATEDDVADGAAVTVVSWGSSYLLQEFTFAVLGRAACEYVAGYGYKETLCLTHQINEGICTGDAGSGCIIDNKLVAVVGFAFGGCGTELPDIAHKVVYASEWINSIINK